MPCPHQVTASVLACPDQVTGRFLLDGGDHDRGDLVQPQQAGQVDCVLGVGLDPITRGPLQLGRCHHLAPDPGPIERPRQAETRRAGLIGHRPRTGQLPDPGPDVLREWPIALRQGATARRSGL